MTEAAVYLAQIKAMNEAIDKQLADLPEDLLHTRPGPSLNPVGFNVWHLLRVWDIDLNWMIKGQKPSEDAWHRGGFTEKSGYNPDGKGARGLGFGTAYTDADVDEFNVSLAVLKAYQQQLMDETEEYLNSASDADLERELPPVASAPGKVTVATRLQHTVSHSWNHIGELRFAKGMLGYHDPSYPAAS